MQYDNLPKELRDNGKFCVWKFEARKGKTKPGKVPYQISGKRAQSNNEHTFSNYSDAVAAVSHYDGLGLGIFRGFSAVDVDHCVNTPRFFHLAPGVLPCTYPIKPISHLA